MNKLGVCLTVCLFSFVIVNVCPGWAQQGEKKPIHITSDAMYYTHAKDQVRFKGQVHAVRENFQIWAKELTVFLGQGQGKAKGTGLGLTGGQDIDHLLAKGDVRLKEGDRKGFCQRAWFYPDQGLLRMEGSPRLEEDKNSVQGTIIKLYLRDNKSEVIGGDEGRVDALFYSTDEGLGDAGISD
jgi:lipopolysaccharide export system protein LptA